MNKGVLRAEVAIVAALICAAALFGCSEAPPPRCDAAYTAALKKAEAAGDKRRVEILSALEPVELWQQHWKDQKPGEQRKFVCQIFVPEDLIIAFDLNYVFAETKDQSAERYLQIMDDKQVRAKLDGKQVEGWMQYSELFPLAKRQGLATGQPIAARADLERYYKMKPQPKPVVSTPLTYKQILGQLIVLGLLLIGLIFATAPAWCKRWRRRVEGAFRDALAAGLEDDIPIGGARWCVRDGGFYPITFSGGARGFLRSAESVSRRGTIELQVRRDRRKKFAIGCTMLVLSLLALGLSGSDNPVSQLVGAIAAFMFGISGLAVAAWYALWEVLYQLGFQSMSGAMVLDPEPVNIGKQEVEGQKAHGGARSATEQEAKAAARGSRPRVDDQEFVD